MILLTVLAVALIVLSVWNLISLNELKKYNRSYRELKDDRYYELKYKGEYLTTIVVVVLSVGTFLGYRWFEEIKENASENLKAKTEVYENRFDSLRSKIDLINGTLEQYKTMVDEYMASINEFDTKQKNIERKAQVSDINLIQLKDRIEAINNENIIKQDLYIVDNLKFAITDSSWRATFYYKDLTTISGDKLPSFSQPPVLLTIPKNATGLTTIYIGKDSFEVDAGMTMGLVDTCKFGIMIKQK
jgi:hypothetical protein